MIALGDKKWISAARDKFIIIESRVDESGVLGAVFLEPKIIRHYVIDCCVRLAVLAQLLNLETSMKNRKLPL